MLTCLYMLILEHGNFNEPFKTKETDQNLL